MSKTLNYGSRSADREALAARIDKHVIRRHTRAGYDRCMELSAQDFARHVALDCSPTIAGAPQVTYKDRSVIFGRRQAFLFD